MSIVKKRVPIEQVPKDWLAGIETPEDISAIQVTIEIISPAPKEEIQQIIDSIVPAVSTVPDSTTTLRQMRDERMKRISLRHRV